MLSYLSILMFLAQCLSDKNLNLQVCEYLTFHILYKLPIPIYTSFPIFPVCDSVYCGQGAQCIATFSGPTCTCVEGFIGNPFPGGQCVPDICSSSNPCMEPSVCIGGRCKERCEGIVCGVGATCDKNTNKCVCDPFFIGNPNLICMPRKFRTLFNVTSIAQVEY